MNLIDPLCKRAQIACNKGVNLELILAEDKCLYGIKAERPRVRIHNQGDTLQVHLKQSLKDRRTLAVILARGFLHLKESLWLEDNWGKQLCFMTLVDGKPDIKRPFLTTRVKGKAVQSPRAVDDDSANMLMHECPPLLALGILLVELGITETIESRREPTDTDVAVNADFFTASRVHELCVDEWGDDYHAAVAACLEPQKFFGQSLDFDDERVCGLVHKHIVMPLEAEVHKSWAKLDTSELW